MNRAIMFDPELAGQLIEQRKKLGIDLYDEVWDGDYVMPSMPSLDHQKVVRDMTGILTEIVVREGRGEVYPGANVSDQSSEWKQNFRVPDVVVVLKEGQAEERDTYIYGGPDFLVEIQSPKDETDLKIPFYSKIQVRELLIIHRDTRELRLYRHDGEYLGPVEPSTFQAKKWLVSEVLPLAFRRKTLKGKPLTELRRTDGQSGHWTI